MSLDHHRMTALQTTLERTHATLLDHAQSFSDVLAIWDQIKKETAGRPDVSSAIIENVTLKAEVECLRRRANDLESLAEALVVENTRLRYFESCMKGMGRR
jgi:hypothetical protein